MTLLRSVANRQAEQLTLHRRAISWFTNPWHNALDRAACADPVGCSTWNIRVDCTDCHVRLLQIAFPCYTFSPCTFYSFTEGRHMDKKRLGRGLDALLGADTAVMEAPAEVTLE